MINEKFCQHGIKYDIQTLFCFYVACNYERRLKSHQCQECQTHQHNHGNCCIIKSENKLSAFVYAKICQLEYHILNKTDLCLKEQIEYGKSLIENLQYIENMPEFLLFKTIQISQLLQNQNILDDPTKEFVSLSKQMIETDKQLTLIQNTENYMLSKAINKNLMHINFFTSSPNQKYLLIGARKYVYLYDIQTKLNIKIYKFGSIEPYLGQFSNNSSYIILAQQNGILILDICTDKKIKIGIKYEKINKMHVYQNHLHIIHEVNLNTSTMRLIKICLNTNRIIFSQVLEGEDVKDQVFFCKDQISFISKLNLFFIDSSTRNFQLQIDLSNYKQHQFIVLNKNEILSLLWGQLSIWNIDYENKCLIQKNIFPLNARDILIRSSFYGFFSFFLNDKIFSVDQKKLNDISYIGQLVDELNSIINRNSNEFDKTFIINSREYISILERVNKI